jgi:hypothetical protein
MWNFFIPKKTLISDYLAEEEEDTEDDEEDDGENDCEGQPRITQFQHVIQIVGGQVHLVDMAKP